METVINIRECNCRELESLYLDLMKMCLTRYVFGEQYRELNPYKRGIRGPISGWMRQLLERFDLELVRRVEYDPKKRLLGHDYPVEAETMIGLRRMDNLQHCITDALDRGVPGDLIETGVWRGGAAIFMRAVLKARGDCDRLVWAADSFMGLPKPDAERYPEDAGDKHWTMSHFAVSLETVKGNFDRYGLLDDQVRFLVGWFKDTLPTAPIQRLAVLRLDGDMYESTMTALCCLYPKLSVGGYVIIDDYGDDPGLKGCKAAVNEFRTQNQIKEPLLAIEGGGVYWQRSE
jgi:O-methyltransferase